MDFFAAGGFQQLFNDLDDVRDLHGISTELHAETGVYDTHSGYEYCDQLSVENNNNNSSTLIRLTCAEDPFVLATTTNEQTLLELRVDWCGDPTETTYFTLEHNDSNNNYNCDCEKIDDHELQLTLDHLLSPTAAHPSDLIWNVNSSGEFATNEAYEHGCTELEHNNNMGNSSSADSSSSSSSISELETAAFITREMAEWEEKFLDNYIEIPELIDFLPEKTPLCTETCEHFLHESSKNLKLHRKVRGAKRSSESNSTVISNNEERSPNGYACNFGTCDKIYAKPAHLKAHLRRHMGEKPYICNWPECTWRFSRSDELARHRRSHSGVKPYQCSYCMKCFARSDHLTKHRKVHERRLLAASKAGKIFDGTLPHSVFTVRPGRKRKNQI